VNGLDVILAVSSPALRSPVPAGAALQLFCTAVCSSGWRSRLVAPSLATVVEDRGAGGVALTTLLLRERRDASGGPRLETAERARVTLQLGGRGGGSLARSSPPLRVWFIALTS